MPMPMTLPTTSAVHVQNPRTRDDSDAVVSVILLNRVCLTLRGASSEQVRQWLACIGKRQRYRVQAMPLAGGRWPVRKYMSQVATATCAHLFHPHHTVARIAQALDVRLVVGPEETRPAG